MSESANCELLIIIPDLNRTSWCLCAIDIWAMGSDLSITNRVDPSVCVCVREREINT